MPLAPDLRNREAADHEYFVCFRVVGAPSSQPAMTVAVKTVGAISPTTLATLLKSTHRLLSIIERELTAKRPCLKWEVDITQTHLPSPKEAP